MAVREILQLGDPLLRRSSTKVEEFSDPAFQTEGAALLEVLMQFRERYGFGRAVSAPQIDVPRRVIALCLGGEPFLMVNPVVEWQSDETFTLWDDCMSFPDLLVRVRRHASISVRYQDAGGGGCEMRELDRATSELLQHEIDHLDGILAVDRGLDRDSLVLRSVFEQNPEHFSAQVDYVIEPVTTPARKG